MIAIYIKFKNDEKWVMKQWIVMTQHPPLSNLFIKLLLEVTIHHLILWNTFHVRTDIDVKKLPLTSCWYILFLKHIFLSWQTCWLPLRWLPLGFYVKSINPCFSTNNNLRNEVWFIFTTFPAYKFNFWSTISTPGMYFDVMWCIPIFVIKIY